MTTPEKTLCFRDILSAERFHYGIELVSSRGIAPPETKLKMEEQGEFFAADPRFSWISITDNPGGNPMLPPDWLARKLAGKGSDLVLHLSCKDLNRNGLESAAWRSAAEGFQNILALTGDYPVDGFNSTASPVFDLDSISLITMLKAMNGGLEVPGRKGKTEQLPATDFFIGCAVSPFKRYEREMLPQLLKLAMKIRCGAQWVIPQLGYDMRKFQEVKLFLDWAGMDVPIIGNVYLLSRFVARMFNRGDIPGCVVSDELLEQVEKYAGGPDKGKSFFRELAAKQLAVFKGLGFAAGYLAGTARPEVFGEIVDLAESYGADDWKAFARDIHYPQKDEFFLFAKDPDTGLSQAGKFSSIFQESLTNPPKTPNVSFFYQSNRLVHATAFTHDKGIFPHLSRVYGALEGEGLMRKLLGRALYAVEKAGKELMFGCRDCGDCSLPDCAYLCPRSACSKNTRNGPCGGSRNGRCELDDKDCLWARAYDRLNYYGEALTMLDRPPVIYNSDLDGTSAWSNTFLSRDHYAPKEGEETALPPLVPDPLSTSNKGD